MELKEKEDNKKFEIEEEKLKNQKSKDKDEHLLKIKKLN